MSDFISTLASQAGIDTATAEKGAGALLSSLKGNLSSDVFTQVATAVPNANTLLTGFESLKGSPNTGGLSALAGMGSALFGGQSQGATSLLNNFSTAGFSADTLKMFIPVILGLLKSKLSPEIMTKVESSIPGISSLAGNSLASGLLSKAKSIF